MRWFLKNPGFELGDRDWNKGAGWSIAKDVTNARSGSWVASFPAATGTRLSIAASLAVRPGGKISAECWQKHSADYDDGSDFILSWRDKDGAELSAVTPGQVAAGTTSYTKVSLTDSVAPDRAKAVVISVRPGTATVGTLWADDLDASGDIIDTIPASAIIREKRIVNADTVSAFDPLIGETKFSEFNAGMSDRWSGVYHFIPALGADLGELAAFIQRISKRERFFAYDPDHTVPLNGVVNGMVVDGAVSGGSTRIPVSGGPVSTTALAYGDYVEIGAQYFRVQRPLEIGPEGTGDLIVWPSVRAALADGEDVITDQPKMVARRTSEFDLRRFEAHPEGPISMSWIEYV